MSCPHELGLQPPPRASRSCTRTHRSVNLKAGTHGRSAVPCVPLGGRKLSPTMALSTGVSTGQPGRRGLAGAGSLRGPGFLELGAGSLPAPYVEGTVHMRAWAAGSLHCQTGTGWVSMWPVHRVHGPQGPQGEAAVRVTSVRGLHFPMGFSQPAWWQGRSNSRHVPGELLVCAPQGHGSSWRGAPSLPLQPNFSFLGEA